MQFLGGENNVHAKPLVEALKAAKAKSSFQNFLERARKQVTRAEDFIAKAVEQKTVHAGSRRGGRTVEAIRGGKPTPPSDPVVTELQWRIEEFVQERDALFPCRECGMQTVPRPSTPSRQCQVPRVARVVQCTQLRIAQCFGVWRHHHYCESVALEGQGTPRWVLSQQRGH